MRCWAIPLDPLLTSMIVRNRLNAAMLEEMNEEHNDLC